MTTVVKTLTHILTESRLASSLLSAFQTITINNNHHQYRSAATSSPTSSLRRNRNSSNTLERLKSALTHSSSAPGSAGSDSTSSLNANSPTPTPPSTPRRTQVAPHPSKGEFGSDYVRSGRVSTIKSPWTGCWEVISELFPGSSGTRISNKRSKNKK